LGRVLDGFGRPIDGKGPLPFSESRRIDSHAPPAMNRTHIRDPIATSIRSIDGLHTCGRGQRMGIFSGPGVGKSTLMSSIAKHTDADVSVVALIGERGREVQEFLANSLGESGLKRCVVVVSTGDDFNEPIPDAVKGITDGHLWLSRALANRGHFPAVDVVQSISRVRGDVCDRDHVRAAQRVLALVATYNDIEDLVNIGAYVPGANPEYDLAVQARPRILAYLRQEAGAPCTLEESKKQLFELTNWIEQM